jgi:hypothetical protein
LVAGVRLRSGGEVRREETRIPIGRRRRRRWIAFACGVAALVAVVTVASAKLVSRRATVTIQPASDSSVTAKCDSGSEAVSGGFDAPGFTDTGPGPSILPLTGHRTSSRRWRDEGHNFQTDPGGAGQFVAYVYCDTHEPGLSTRSKTKTIAAFANGTVTVRCPTGTEAVSGGFEDERAGVNIETTVPYTSERVGTRAWKVEVLNADQANPHPATAFAYCDARRPGLVARTMQANLNAGQTNTLDVECRHGAKPFSGGFASSFVAATRNAGFPFTSRRLPGGLWRVSAVGNGSTGSSTETAIAYCKA